MTLETQSPMQIAFEKSQAKPFNENYALWKLMLDKQELETGSRYAAGFTMSWKLWQEVWEEARKQTSQDIQANYVIIPKGTGVIIR